MVNPIDSIFHVVYPFDEWIYSDWYITWEKLARSVSVNVDTKFHDYGNNSHYSSVRLIQSGKCKVVRSLSL